MQNVTKNSISLLQIATGQLNNRTGPSILDHLYFSWKKKRKEKSQLRFISVQFFLHLKESSTFCDFAECFKSLSACTHHLAGSTALWRAWELPCHSKQPFLSSPFLETPRGQWTLSSHIAARNGKTMSSAPSLFSPSSLYGPTSVQKEEEHMSMGDLSTIRLFASTTCSKMTAHKHLQLASAGSSLKLCNQENTKVPTQQCKYMQVSYMEEEMLPKLHLHGLWMVCRVICKQFAPQHSEHTVASRTVLTSEIQFHVIYYQLPF